MNEDFSMVKVVIHWIWTFPACIIVILICGELYGPEGQFSDNPLLFGLFYTLGIGGLIGFVTEFTIRLIKATKGRRRPNVSTD